MLKRQPAVIDRIERLGMADLWDALPAVKTPPGVMVWDRENVSGVLELRDISESVAPVVADMRARGADLVLVLAHSGLHGTSYDTLTTGLAPENESEAIARDMIESLLQHARIEAGRLEVMTAPVDVLDVASGVIAELRPQAEEKGLELHLSPVGALPPLETDARLPPQHVGGAHPAASRSEPCSGNIKGTDLS